MGKAGPAARVVYTDPPWMTGGCGLRRELATIETDILGSGVELGFGPYMKAIICWRAPERGTDGRCGVVGRIPGRGPTRRAPRCRRSGGRGVLPACHFRDSILFPRPFYCLGFRCFLDNHRPASFGTAHGGKPRGGGPERVHARSLELPRIGRHRPLGYGPALQHPQPQRHGTPSSHLTD
jgi:hypothetical protein